MAAITIPPSEYKEEFESLLRNAPASLIVTNHILERVPFVFDNDWDLYRAWRRKLGDLLEVDQCSIVLTGSSCSGFSLNPKKNLRPFNRKSDIDVAIVSDHHFTLGWRTLRSLQIADLIKTKERSALRAHQSNYIYWGCIATDKILRLMPFSKQWILARTDMAGIDPTSGRDINFRIYRDFQSLRSYQEKSVHSLQRKMLSSDQNESKIS